MAQRKIVINKGDVVAWEAVNRKIAANVDEDENGLIIRIDDTHTFRPEDVMSAKGFTVIRRARR